MNCQGRVWLNYEVHGKQKNIYVFGGGHVGKALLQHLSYLDYHTVLIDNRKEYAENKNASEYYFEDYIEYSNSFGPEPDSYFIILTHGHNFDYDIALALYSRKIKTNYIGLIASKSKAKTIKDKLRKELGNGLDFSNFYSPIGLDIGGTTPQEIAIAIIAELQSIRYEK